MKTPTSLPLYALGAISAALLTLTGSGAIAVPKGTLNYATQIQNTNWNPLVKSGETHTGIPYEGLLKVAPDGFSLLPHLAKSWELTPTELSLTLQSGVVFHDGTPFNAEAVKTNLEWIKTSGTQWAATLATVSEIVVKDDTHLTLKLSRPTPTMAARLATRGLFMVSPKALETKDWTKAVGTGAWVYDVAASQPGTKEVFKLFDKYWALDKVGVESIVMHTIQDPNIALNALRTGLVQVTEMAPSLNAAAESAGYKVHFAPTLTQHFLFLDRKNMFADINVRKAFCSAIDLDAISIASFEGSMKPASQRFPSGQSGHNPEVRGWKYDPEAAKKYLAAAGNPKISLTLPMYPGIQTTMTLVAQMLRQIGIDANTQSMTTGQYFTYYQSDRYPLQINTSATESIGPLDYYQFRFGPNGVGNPFKVAVPDLDAIVDRALAEPDPTKQEAIWREMTKYIHDNALDCNFYLQPTHWAFDPKKMDKLLTTTMRPSALRYDEIILK
jgi:peptide/nickel transport system substrate-binding protein